MQLGEPLSESLPEVLYRPGRAQIFQQEELPVDVDDLWNSQACRLTQTFHPVVLMQPPVVASNRLISTE